MSMIDILSGLIIMFYLFIQARSDSKTGQVYTILNNGALLIYGIIYVCDMIQYYYIPYDALFCVLIIILFYKLRMYASGDMKGILTIFFSYKGDIFTLLITIFITDIIFIIQNIKKKKEKNNAERGRRYPYFPALLCGYVIVFIMRILL